MILICFAYYSNHERLGELGTFLVYGYALSFRECFLFLVVIRYSFYFLFFSQIHTLRHFMS